MSWNYSGDPLASARDAVRFLIQDTDAHEKLLLDTEIAYLLSIAGNSPLMASIRACEVIQTKYSRWSDETTGAVSQSYNQRSIAYQKLGQVLKARSYTEDCSPFAGGITDDSGDDKQPVFTKELMTNLDSQSQNAVKEIISP